jgi:hypothetical protein
MHHWKPRLHVHVTAQKTWGTLVQLESEGYMYAVGTIAVL